MDRIRLLYVEDEPVDRELTLAHLRQQAPDLEVRAVGTGREALEVLRGEEFDLVLLDYCLPDVDGLQLLGAVLASAQDAAVVMVTGAGDNEVAVAALKFGAADYVIKKPGYLGRLPTAIREALGRFRHERSRRASGLRILYAEHDPDDVSLTLRHLALHAPHMEVETASMGGAALRKLEAGGYDLLLLDYRMPDLNGLEILEQTRERGILIPVVMVTGHGDEETAVQILKLGAADYVVKREGYLTQLTSTIEKAVAQRALADEKEALLTLNGIARAVASTLDLDAVLEQVAEAAVTLLRADRTLVSLLSEDGSELVPISWHGGPPEVASRLRFRMGQGVPGRAAVERRAVSVPDIRMAETATYREEAVLEGIGGVLSVPMLVHEQLLGVITVAVTGTRTFTPQQEALLAALAAHAAVAIMNARLYKEVRLAAVQLEATVKVLDRRAQELARSNAELEQFAYVASHDLQEPLRMVATYTELLARRYKGKLDADADDFIAYAVDGATQMQMLINDLMSYSRVGTRAKSLEPTDGEAVLSQALTNLKEAIKESGAMVTHDPLPRVIADRIQLVQVFQNLIGNAIKFRGDKPPEIHIGAKRQDDGWQFYVRDNGIGIDPQYADRIFVIFQRLHGRGEYPGTGIGLAVCKKIVERHGGRIWVESPGEGQGSTFTFTLPLEGLQERPEAAGSDTPKH